jgi:hypothetical protein
MMSISGLDIFNADYTWTWCGKRERPMFRLPATRVCTGKVTDKLCEAINSVSLLDVVANLDIPFFSFT